MPYCEECGDEVSLNTKFCSSCGTKTGSNKGKKIVRKKIKKEKGKPSLIDCSVCSKPMANSTSKCPHCGHLVRETGTLTEYIPPAERYDVDWINIILILIVLSFVIGMFFV